MLIFVVASPPLISRRNLVDVGHQCASLEKIVGNLDRIGKPPSSFNLNRRISI
jgi:hypothetical protein